MRPPSGSALQIEADDFAVDQTKIDRRLVSRPDLRRPFRHVGGQLAFRHCIGACLATMIHQGDEGRLAVGLVVRQPPHLAKGPIDELRAQLGIEQHDAILDLVQRSL